MSILIYIPCFGLEIAKENNVPIIENPPVARALFNEVEISQDIPSEYYKAVADIIRLVINLKGIGFKTL